MIHQGILRGESITQCELSDLCDVVQKDEGTQPCQILVMQIASGKTNLEKTIYGRVMRVGQRVGQFAHVIGWDSNGYKRS